METFNLEHENLKIFHLKLQQKYFVIEDYLKNIIKDEHSNTFCTLKKSYMFTKTL